MEQKQIKAYVLGIITFYLVNKLISLYKQFRVVKDEL